MIASRAHELRKKHRRFTFEEFTIDRIAQLLRLRFIFELAPDITFASEWTIESIDQSRLESLDSAVVRNLAFHLGLIEMMSYWKAAAPHEIHIRAGTLDEHQLCWLRELLIRGLGEFFYRNNIDFRDDDYVRITAAPAERQQTSRSFKEASLRRRTLLLLSGGKDSALALEVLKESGSEVNCLLLNPLESAYRIARLGGCFAPIVVRRTIDPRLLELNRAGYLNGHTPFSALLAVLGVACAVLFGYHEVVVANERSADEDNCEFLGMPINHQYSKTLIFERSFREYCRSYLSPQVNFFSILRPLLDIQVSGLFSKYSSYLKAFRSCNRGQKTDSWCGGCPKCFSTFLTFSPFLSIQKLVDVFGSDFLQHPLAAEMLALLLGNNGPKPFECVATRDEVGIALLLASKRRREAGLSLPAALTWGEIELAGGARRPTDQTPRELLNAWSDNHYLPESYEKMLKARAANLFSSA